MIIFLEDGSRHDVHEKDVIGSGGEGTVFRLPGSRGILAKVYENPTVGHAQKLQSFLGHHWNFPATIAAPQGLVKNSNGRIIGFTMPQFASVNPLKDFSNHKKRSALGITNAQVMDVMISASQSLDQIHPQGLIVGDLNDLNLLYSNKTTYYIDVDSWQFGTYPCPVATENYLDPNLYGQNLLAKPCFTTDNDWYSFAVLLFRSLLLVHPYGGNHPSVKKFFERAQNKISVFDKAVTYPSIGLPKELLSDELLETFDQIFSKGQRGHFPRDILLSYRQSLVQCPSCQSWFPLSRRFCPLCHEKSLVVLPPVVVSGRLSVSHLLTTSGTIISAKIIGNQEIYSLVKEADDLVLYKLSRIRPQKKIVVGKYERGIRYEINEKYLTQSTPNSDTLSVSEIKDDKVQPLIDTSTNLFGANQSPMFRLSGNFLYRIAGSTLTRTEFKGPYPLETPLRQIIPDQTWFTVSDPLPEPIVLGCFRVFRQQQFWLIANGRNRDLNLPPLELGEGLVDLSARFTTGSVLLLRHTLQSGVDYVRLDMVDLDGQLLYSEKVLLSDLPEEKIHGLIYAQRQIYTATDNGIVRFNPATKQTVEFSVTKGHVSALTSLIAFQQGILAINDNSIDFLTLS